MSNYTSRTDAMGYVCPLCDAGEGEKCKGVRGKLRESVHRDRMRRAARELGHHEIRTLTLEGNELVDASGVVLGRLVGVELDVQAADWGNLRRGDVAVDVPKTERSSPTTGGVGGGDTLFEAPDQVQLVFDHYRKVVKGKGNSRFSPETRRLIRKALAERPLELCLRAISGLAVSPHHNGQNDTGTEYLQIKYAIGKVRQTESVGDRIDLMASKAVAERADGKLSVEELLRSVPSDRHWIVRDLMSKAIAAIRQGRRDESSEERLKSLVGAGPIIDDGSFAGWERLA